MEVVLCTLFFMKGKAMSLHILPFHYFWRSTGAQPQGASTESLIQENLFFFIYLFFYLFVFFYGNSTGAKLQEYLAMLSNG